LQKLANDYPLLESTLRELALRQEFRRAIVLRRMKSFPNKEQMKEAFDEIDQDRSGTLNKHELRLLMASLGAAFTDEDFIGLVSTLDVNESGEVDFNEFQNIFNES
jgi:Ca2+-binding EF-hand superfamily protein